MMGMANMDFVIRECQAVVEGPLAMIRLGTCGAIQPPAHLGNFLVASEGSICVRYMDIPCAIYSCCVRYSHILLDMLTPSWVLSHMLVATVVLHTALNVAAT